LAQRQGREIPLKEAAAAWYDDQYQPVIQVVRDRELLEGFPGLTEADLFMWVLERLEEVEEEIGWTLRPERVAGDLADGRSRRRRSPDSRESTGAEDGSSASPQMDLAPLDSASVRLFPEVLVPISGTERGWLALEQALVVAQREGSALRGFHVVRSDSEQSAQRARDVQAQFDLRCQAAGIAGQLVVEVGPVARTICQRARWTDLVVANLAFPPGRSLAGKLQSGFRTLVHRCSRPVLAVPHVSPLSRALLAFDGSPRAREALVVATYLAARWGIPLAVVTVIEPDRASAGTLEAALDYMAAHGVQAHAIKAQGAVADSILQAARDQRADLLIMGGYGYSPMWEAMLGSAVDRLLRECQQPMLICK
jgi:nucleotide-binding universal stress UspA family protein